MGSLHADLVAIQEAEPQHWEALAARLPHGAFHAGARSTGMGLAARHPVETRQLPLVWRPAPWLRLEPAHWPGLSRALDVLNVHIAAPHVYRPPGYGFWLRRLQLQALEAHLHDALGPLDGASSERDGTPRTLLVGDFNATPRWPLYRRLAGQLTDAALATAQRRGRPVEPTWGHLRRGRRWLRIDHAFTHGVDALDVQVVPLLRSDHSALVVDLPA